MSTFKALLDTPQDWMRGLKVRPPDLVHLPRASAKLAGLGQVKLAEPTEVLQARVLKVLEAGGVESLPSRDLRDICRVFFQPPHSPGRVPHIAEALAIEVGRQQRRSALFSLIDSYLDGFQIDAPAVEGLSVHLGRLFQEWPWRQEDAWPKLHRDLKLFDHQEGPKRIADVVMDRDNPPMGVLDSVGLGGNVRRKGGMAEAAFNHACQSTMKLVGSGAIKAQNRLIAWAVDGDDQLIYPRSWSFYAGALFVPWYREQPSETYKNRLMDIAVKYAGDPRTNPGTKWTALKERAPVAYEVIMRWLTKASFEQFFSIVDQMTDRPDMWRQRKRFWSQYLDANMISDAWVVFGADGASRAIQVARQNGNEALTKFGRLASGGGRTPQHTALIMKIGSLTVVEWSHNGRWNIWRQGDQGQPPLHRYNVRGRPDYDASELMYAPIGGSHHENWQRGVAHTIHYETGLRP